MFWAILLAAGFGTRYLGKKQDQIFHVKPIWRCAYEIALSVVCDGNIIAVGKDIPGCITRTGSVINGLTAQPENIDRVVIVEAARPIVTKE